MLTNTKSLIILFFIFYSLIPHFSFAQTCSLSSANLRSGAGGIKVGNEARIEVVGNADCGGLGVQIDVYVRKPWTFVEKKIDTITGTLEEIGPALSHFVRNRTFTQADYETAFSPKVIYFTAAVGSEELTSNEVDFLPAVGNGGGVITIPIIKALPKLPCVFQDNNTCGDPEAVKGLDDFFLWLYNFGFWVVGIALFVALLWAGINYFLAGPNIGKVKQAKDMLTNVLLGFILLLSAWLILNTINPDLIKSAFKLKPLGQQLVGIPASEPQPPSVIEPIEETPAGPNCSIIKACFQYQEEGSCNANTCSVSNPGNAGCKWRNNECVDSELECSTIEACFQYDESDCNADSCEVNYPDGCEWKNNECVDGEPCSDIEACLHYQNESDCNENSCNISGANDKGCEWKDNACTDRKELTCLLIETCSQYQNESDCNENSCDIDGANNRGCEWKDNACTDREIPPSEPPPPSECKNPDSETRLGGTRNDPEFCDDFSFSITSRSDVLIYCATGGGAIAYFAKEAPPSVCPPGSPRAGETIPEGGCINISSFCYGDSEASFDTSILNKEEEDKCINKWSDGIILRNLPAGDYFAGSHGPGVSEVLVCLPE